MFKKFKRIFFKGGGALALAFLLLATSFLTTCAEEVSDELFLAYGGSAADAKVGSADYRFTGWNTKPDGLGINYDSMSALDAIGKDPTISALTLYAQWEGSIVFDANGGVIQAANGVSTALMTESERAAIGQTRASVWKNIKQGLATNLAASKSGVHFVLWNTKPDGTGTNLEDYDLEESGLTTFYAIYYQSDFEYTGAVQTFRAPVKGWYQVSLYGAQGAGAPSPGLGGYVSGRIELQAGEILYVYVGGAGQRKYGGWNGGGTNFSNYSETYGGGGATDIRLSYNTAYSGRIAVAGGGGSTDDYQANDGHGGAGGGIVGGAGAGYKGGEGGTQTSGYAFGVGQSGTMDDSGSGGGGYYGGMSGKGVNAGGGGGSSYMSGLAGCSKHYSGKVFTNATTVSGCRSGNGFAQLLLISRT